MSDHGLGRKPNVPDARDWTPDKLHRTLAAKHASAKGEVPTDALLDLTVREAIDSGNPFFTTWKGILALWRWIKSLVKPQPIPTPPPSTDGPLWECKVVLDQGDYGTCVGNAWAGWGNSAPIEDNFTETDARAIYYEATCIAGSCDPTGQNGSSTRDGVKAMQARGRLSAYAFATSLADVDEWLDNHGPVVIGIDWTDSMFSPDADGTVHYTGPAVGGHEIFLRQNLRSQGKYRVRNSWGTGWGVDGDFYLTRDDFEKLLNAGGDACLAAEVA